MSARYEAGSSHVDVYGGISTIPAYCYMPFHHIELEVPSFQTCQSVLLHRRCCLGTMHPQAPDVRMNVLFTNLFEHMFFHVIDMPRGFPKLSLPTCSALIDFVMQGGGKDQGGSGIRQKLGLLLHNLSSRSSSSQRTEEIWRQEQVAFFTNDVVKVSGFRRKSSLYDRWHKWT